MAIFYTMCRYLTRRTIDSFLRRSSKHLELEGEKELVRGHLLLILYSVHIMYDLTMTSALPHKVESRKNNSCYIALDNVVVRHSKADFSLLSKQDHNTNTILYT